MALRTVRLEPEIERALEEIQKATGLSASAAIRKGLVVLRDRVREDAVAAPYEIYAALDPGPGGHARAPARQAKRGIKKLLRRKQTR
jgi:hypothetical protein